MDSMYCRLDRYMYICMLCVHVYDIAMHVCIGYVRCMLCFFAKKCFRLVLHHVRDLGFHKARLGIIKTCFKQGNHAHDRGLGQSRP